MRHRKKPMISVVMNIHNMRREAPRTLFTLSDAYQKGISAEEYEVLVVENGSSEPLDPAEVTRFGKNFSYTFVESDCPSPCRALNLAVQKSRADHIALMIDGARMLSPGVLRLMKESIRREPNSLAYTLVLHLGHERQSVSILNGYNQQAEDALLTSVAWESNGYELFDISSLGGSSAKGYEGSCSESGCFLVSKSDFDLIGGYDERFVTPGGGLSSIDLFRRLIQLPHINPFLLLGEGTFHQFHGGAMTNSEQRLKVWEMFSDEYEAIRGTKFKGESYSKTFIGEMNENARRFFNAQSNN